MTQAVLGDRLSRRARLLQHPAVAEACRQVVGRERERRGIVPNRLLEVLSRLRGDLGRGCGPDRAGNLARAWRIRGQLGLVGFRLRGRERVDLERVRHGVEAGQIDEGLDVRRIRLQLSLEVGDEPFDWHLTGFHPHVDARQMGRGGEHSEGEGENDARGHGDTSADKCIAVSKLDVEPGGGRPLEILHPTQYKIARFSGVTPRR